MLDEGRPPARDPDRPLDVVPRVADVDRRSLFADPDFERRVAIGRGSTGEVYKVRDVRGKDCAVKRVELGRDVWAKQAVNEVELLRRLQHVHVVEFAGAFSEGPALFLVTEFADRGDLERALALQRRAMLQPPVVAFVSAQILLGLDYLHKCDVLHRDLKASNVLLFSSGTVKLGDFGVAKVCGDASEAHNHTVVGSPYYMCPEIVEAQPYDSKSDVWAFGCVLYQLCALRRPFEAPTMPALFVRILDGQYLPIPAQHSEQQPLVERSLQMQAADRASARELLASKALAPTAAQLEAGGVPSFAGTPGFHFVAAHRIPALLCPGSPESVPWTPQVVSGRPPLPHGRGSGSGQSKSDGSGVRRPTPFRRGTPCSLSRTSPEPQSVCKLLADELMSPQTSKYHTVGRWTPCPDSECVEPQRDLANDWPSPRPGSVESLLSGTPSPAPTPEPSLARTARVEESLVTVSERPEEPTSLAGGDSERPSEPTSIPEVIACTPRGPQPRKENVVVLDLKARLGLHCRPPPCSTEGQRSPRSKENRPAERPRPPVPALRLSKESLHQATRAPTPTRARTARDHTHVQAFFSSHRAAAEHVLGMSGACSARGYPSRTPRSAARSTSRTRCTLVGPRSAR